MKINSNLNQFDTYRKELYHKKSALMHKDSVISEYCQKGLELEFSVTSVASNTSL
jgi:hypothetical protein